ncbi:MAG: hypothetical protein MZV65_47945 [Chromatiales bacterium]|nr:hypothetical protein [Chromatiales bacterium]
MSSKNFTTTGDARPRASGLTPGTTSTLTLMMVGGGGGLSGLGAAGDQDGREHRHQKTREPAEESRVHAALLIVCFTRF